jgi:hypothetical protein
VITFHLVCLAWIFFRAASPSDSCGAVLHLVQGMPASLKAIVNGRGLDAELYLGQGAGRFFFILALLVVGPALRAHFGRASAEEVQPPHGSTAWSGSPPWVLAGVYAVMFYLVAFSGVATQSFIYAQF